MNDELEEILEGENLVFYRNIKDLKALTNNARALIARSNTCFNDIVENRERIKIVRGTDEIDEQGSLNLFTGECQRCGLLHGAHDYCVLQEILEAEKNVRASPRKVTSMLPLDTGDDSLEVLKQGSSSKALPKPRKYEPSKDRAKEWEDLLHKEMTPEELQAEYSKICLRYGTVNGGKFLFARSLALEGPKKVKVIKESDDIDHGKNNKKCSEKFALITEKCIPFPEHKSRLQCPRMPTNVHEKMGTLLDPESPCSFKASNWERDWKSSLKFHPNIEVIERQTIEDELTCSQSTPSVTPNPSGMCSCGLIDCFCGQQPLCNPPEKKCPTVASDHQNNYVRTIREKLRKRRLLQGEFPPDDFHQLKKYTSKEVSYDILRKDSELMMRKAYEVHRKDLQNCLVSAVGEEDAQLAENVSKIADITSVFTKPEDRIWDRWIQNLETQEKDMHEDAIEDISGNSEIPSSRCSVGSSSSSSTDREFRKCQHMFNRMTYAEEPLLMTKNLQDYLFDKILARLRKSMQKSSLLNLFHRYTKSFISHVTNLVCTNSIGDEAVDMLNLYFRGFRSFIPKKIWAALKLKRLEVKDKKLTKKLRRRNYIEGIQLGKQYRRPRKSIKYTKDGGYVGIYAKDRKLLKEPTHERLTKCSVGDEHVLLSKRRIHYQYRLLRILFNGTMQSEDKESLMDKGLKERLSNFKKTLSQAPSHVEMNSDSEDEDVSILKPAVQGPLKVDEKKLKKSDPGCFDDQTDYDCNCRQKMRLNDKGSASSLFHETRQKICNSASYKSPSNQKVDPPSWRATLSRGQSSNSSQSWGDYILSLSKTSKSSSKQLTRAGKTKVPSRTLPSQSVLYSRKPYKPGKWEEFCLPTPPFSDSSCDEGDFDLTQHRVPPKEETHIEKSARTETLATKKHVRKKPRKVEESEISDKSSDSYVPKLLKIPPKRKPKNSVSLGGYAHRGTAAHKTNKGTARFPYSSDSTDTDQVEDYQRKIYREGRAWNHKSLSSHRKLPPHLATGIQNERNSHVPSSVSRKAGNETETDRNRKSIFTSPLPKAGPSILKKSALPEPPNDGSDENQTNTHSVDVSRVKLQSFTEPRHQTTSQPPESLVRSAHVVTERLLKAAPENPVEGLGVGSVKKHSVQSRGTFDAVIGVTSSSSKKAAMPPLAVSKAEQEPQGEPIKPMSITIQLPKASSSHGHQQSDHEEASGVASQSNQMHRTDSIAVPSSKRTLKRASELASDAFRRRSVVSLEHEKKDPQSKVKTGKKNVGDKDSLRQSSMSSMMGLKLKKMEDIGPTKKKLFNLDIGQGINCINYLKANAPGADVTKRKELVDLLVTPVEIKPAPKKAMGKVDKEETSMTGSGSIVGSLPSSREFSRVSVIPSSNVNKKIQVQSAHDDTPLRKSCFKTLDQIYKEVHGINRHNTPRQFVDNDYEYELKKKQQLTKHKIL